MVKLFQALIVDPNSDDVNALVNDLEATKMFHRPYTCDSLEAAYQLLTTQEIDLLFMEAEIKGKSTLDFISWMPDHPPIIVISAHAEYAVQCFDLKVADFIQKPYTVPRLYRAMNKALLALKSPDTPKPAYTVQPERGNIYLKMGRKTVRVYLEDIQFFQPYGIYVKVFTKQGVLVANEKISKIETQLLNSQFIRIHKSSIVNVQQITRIETKTIHVDKKQLPIGVTYHDRVHATLKKLGVEK
jgi:DNA-binding LytR/AlgR family response regulator